MMKWFSLIVTIIAFGYLGKCSESPPILSYRVTFEKCQITKNKSVIAIRKWIHGSLKFILVVNPSNLETSVIRDESIECEPLSITELDVQTNRYSQALIQQQKNYNLSNKKGSLNVGVAHSNQDSLGSYLSIDLCPSRKPLDKSFFEFLAKNVTRPQAELNIAVSGLWMDTHKNDLEWLKNQIKNKIFKVTWMNHSDHHKFIKGIPDQANFLLLPQTNFEKEVLNAEIKMLTNGIVPSIFFRFPGLVANKNLLEKLTNFGLVAVGSNAWLAKTAKTPDRGSIILVHGNGNEPVGLKIFTEFFKQHKITYPLKDLNDLTF